MRRDARDAAAGAAGGLVAGAVLTGLMVALERASGTPSDLVLMERRGARGLGLPHPPMRALPGPEEQAGSHAGHLVLSAALGACLGLVRRGFGTTAPKAGLAIGLGLYPLAFALVGPLLGLTRPPWRDRPRKVAQNILMHAVFGAVTGLVADRIERRTG